MTDIVDKKFYNFEIAKEEIEEIYKGQIENPIIRFDSSPAFVIQKDTFKKMIELNSEYVRESEDFFLLAFFYLILLKK